MREAQATEPLIDDGGPAFPNSGSSDSPLYASYGMSLRDWFAGQALAGFAASLVGQDRRDVMDGIVGGLRVSKAAYMYADAMLAERVAKTTENANA